MSRREASVPDSLDLDDAEDRLTGVIADQVPHDLSGECTDRELAEFIVFRWVIPAYSPLMLTAEEEKKLEDLRATVRRLARIWASLEFEVAEEIRANAGNEPFSGHAGRSVLSGSDYIGFLSYGPEIIERAAPAAKKLIEGAASIGNRNYPILRVVGACAEVWRELTGKTPKSAAHAGFANFVEMTFEVLEIGASAQNQIRQWAELEASAAK